MTLLKLLNDTRRYLRLDDTSEINSILIDLINDSITDLAREYEFERLKVMESITLDGTGEYDIFELLSNYFLGEINLFSSSYQLFSKYSAFAYYPLTTKTNAYCINGDKLITSGAGELYFHYLTVGNKLFFPMANDTDELLITKYYPDIVKQGAIVNFLKNNGEDDSYKKEMEILQYKISRLKTFENRINHNGKPNIVVRY